VTAWIDSARDALFKQETGEGRWGYRPCGKAFVEPTALAGLALLASTPGDVSDPVAREAADWLAEIQRPDGSLGPSAQIPTPCWGTPYAILLWAALGEYGAQRRKAVHWLLGLAGETWSLDRTSVVGHDASIPGWPWVDGTHSWLEPTALAVLALRRERLESHPRVRDGLRIICDRAIPAGGWNYGNSEVFGKSLRPQPAPTGIALLALAATDAPDDLIGGACRYLRNTLPRIRAPRSLAWGVIGLEACQQRPARADAWLEESFSRVRRDRPSPVDVAQLLLAASRRTLEILGIEAFEGSRA